LQERVAAAQKFHSKEAEEEAKKVPVKTFTPGQPDAQDTTNEVQAPKVVAPTPEQITAIKVHTLFSHNTNTSCSCALKSLARILLM
jgi:U2 small nuclear ribonucleoprotein A'